MPLFGGEKKYLGIDIGTASIKVVQLSQKKDQLILDTYGQAEFANDLLKTDDPDAETRAANALREVLARAKTDSKKVVISLPGLSVFSTMIELPAMPEEELDEAVRFQAKRYVPTPLEEVVLAWNIVEKVPEKKEILEGEENTKSKEEPDQHIVSFFKNPSLKTLFRKEKEFNGTYKVFLTAAPKKIAMKYLRIMEMLGLEVEALESEYFPMTRSLVGKEKNPVLIIDIGADATNFNIVDQGYLRLNHGIEEGGDFITRRLMEAFGVDKANANAYKIQGGLRADLPDRRIADAITPTIDRVIEETQHLVEMYFRRENRRIEKIILIGGTANMPGLPNYFGTKIGLSVTVGFPFREIVYPEALKETLAQIGPSFSVAVGLAMRELVK